MSDHAGRYGGAFDPVTRQLGDSTPVAKIGEIVECLDARNKEIGTALHAREGWKALYPLSNRALWDCKIKRAVPGRR